MNTNSKRAVFCWLLLINFFTSSGALYSASVSDPPQYPPPPPSPPTISITAPISDQRLSNTLFTIEGTAASSWQVSSIQYELNDGPWTNAMGTSSWSATVSLVPGANVIRAYALDPGGNASSTSVVTFDFVVTNQLKLATFGLGALKPNYNNAWLEIGRSYSITPAPASGFTCTNWIVSTNWTGGAVVAGASLQFMMESNLTLQANFVETSAPALLITSPTNIQKKLRQSTVPEMTNALATATGITADNWGVAQVWYQLNNGAWEIPATTNRWTNWTATLRLVAGTNTVKAYAMNLGGHFSTTNSQSVISSNTFRLSLAFINAVPLKKNGLAFNLQLSPGLNGHIQTSTNLIDWNTLTNFAGSNSLLSFLDSGATNSGHRYYRAVIP